MAAASAAFFAFFDLSDEAAMAKYPPKTCRDCGFANWTWSDKAYREGKSRIIVQKPGHCRSEDTAKRAATSERLWAQAPYAECPAWRPVEFEQRT